MTHAGFTGNALRAVCHGLHANSKFRMAVANPRLVPCFDDQKGNFRYKSQRTASCVASPKAFVILIWFANQGCDVTPTWRNLGSDPVTAAMVLRCAARDLTKQLLRLLSTPFNM